MPSEFCIGRLVGNNIRTDWGWVVIFIRSHLSVALVTVSLLALSSCGRSPGLLSEDRPPTDGTIVVYRVHIEQGKITFTGETTLPDGACIRTQLLSDDDAVTWWPSDACVEIHDGGWEISAPLGANGAPEEMDASAEYVLHAWAQDAPSIIARFSFDLAGPAAPES